MAARLPSISSINYSNSCFSVDSKLCTPWNGSKMQQMTVGTYTINNSTDLDNYLTVFGNSPCQPYINYYVCYLLNQNSNCGIKLCDGSCQLINEKLTQCNSNFTYTVDVCEPNKCLPQQKFEVKSIDKDTISLLTVIAILVGCLLPLLCLFCGCRQRRRKKLKQYSDIRDPNFESGTSNELMLRNVASMASIKQSIKNKSSFVSFMSSNKSKKSGNHGPELPETYRPSALNLDFNHAEIHSLLNEVPVGPSRDSKNSYQSTTYLSSPNTTANIRWSAVTDYNSRSNDRREPISIDSGIADIFSSRSKRTVSIQTIKSYLQDTKHFHKNVDIVNPSSQVQTTFSFKNKTGEMFLKGKQSIQKLLQPSVYNIGHESTNNSAVNIGNMMEPIDYNDDSNLSRNLNLSAENSVEDFNANITLNPIAKRQFEVPKYSHRFSTAIDLIDKYKTGNDPSPTMSKAGSK